jgi:hypothetical protein
MLVNMKQPCCVSQALLLRPQNQVSIHTGKQFRRGMERDRQLNEIGMERTFQAYDKCSEP